MDAELKEAFTRIKPVCDMMMSDPKPNNIGNFISRVSELKKDAIQELQQYILYPFITHINSVEIENKFELQRKLVDGVRMVLEKISVNSFEMCMKLEIGLLQLVFDKKKPSMIAEIPEELKLSVMRCQTVLLLNADSRYREMLMNSQVPLLAQAVFVAIHMAKLDKLRSLRLAAIQCVTAHTGTHANLTHNYHITDPSIEKLVVDMLSSILPGVLAGLQDVATCNSNPGHAIVVAAIDAIHRILCITMNDKFLSKRNELTPHDFYNLIIERSKQNNTDVSNKKIKDLLKRSPEWYAMAGNKLILVTKNLVGLKTHEHFKVRKELAIFSYRLLTECNLTMQPSVPLAIEVLVSLTKDDYPEVAQYCMNCLDTFFANATDEVKNKTLDSMCDNFFGNLTCLPRVMNNVDSNRKSTALNLLAGYVSLLSGDGPGDGSGSSDDWSGDASGSSDVSGDGSGDRPVRSPQRLTAALSVPDNMQCLCYALLEAAALRTDLTVLHRQFTRDINTIPTNKTPWITLRHLESKDCEIRLQEICQSLGNAECAELLVDRLMEMFLHQRETEAVYIMNWIGAGSNSPVSLVQRLINTYIEEDLWYLPLEIGSTEKPLTKEDTMDETVYNPRAWNIDSVPGLFEGVIETRYTDISYQTPKAPSYREQNTCANLAEAQKNMLLSCLLTEGLGMMAMRLKQGYQPYLMKTLCLVLERVGSPFEMLHLAGLKAINDIARACGHDSVPDLIRCNADYFTNQVTVRLKKAWNSESALQILSVVMEYSNTSLLDCLYGIVQDVLVQSCDKYYEKNLNAYLQVFLTFVICIRKWFPVDEPQNEPLLALNSKPDVKIDVLKDVREFVKNKQEAEKLLNSVQMERETGKTVEEMYREDMKRKEEEEALDYDDTVTDEKAPLPQHVVVTSVILKRCLHFVTSQCQETTMLTLQILTIGLPVLAPHEDELLPIVHLMWAPFVTKFTSSDAPVMRRGFDLLVVMSSLAKDFIRLRMLREVLPHVYAFLRKAAADSHLKDAGSAYRLSPAYRLQEAALAALPRLLLHLRLPDDRLHHLMAAAHPYLSAKQPKPLQALAVEFYRTVMRYDYGALWRHLTEMCKNEQILIPPTAKNLKLEPVVGTPFVPMNQEYKPNIQQIFDYMVT